MIHTYRNFNMLKRNVLLTRDQTAGYVYAHVLSFIFQSINDGDYFETIVLRNQSSN